LRVSISIDIVLPPTRAVIPSSAAAVPEEWTIPPRGVYTVVTRSATVSLCADDAVARPRPCTHAHVRISILIDKKRNSRHRTRLMRAHGKSKGWSRFCTIFTKCM